MAVLVTVAAAATAAVAAGGVAYAYFTSGGTGTGTAQVGSAAVRGFDLTTDGVATSVLPGGGPQGFDIDARNVTGQSLYLGTVYLEVMTFSGTGDAATSAGADIPGCRADWFVVTSSWDVGRLVPGLSTLSSTTSGTPAPTVALPAAPLDQNACQGAEIGIGLSTTPFGT